MTDSKCLACYLPLDTKHRDYHPTCSKKIFATKEPPPVDISLQDVRAVALKLVTQHRAIPGVQPKLSIDRAKIPKKKNQTEKISGARLTFVGNVSDLTGHFILKPPADKYPFLPEVEDLTMHLAELCKIKTAQHALIRLKSGEISYITKRFDRFQANKLAMEDMAQLTGVLTENKYNSSMEKVGKCILKYSSNPGVDAVSYLNLSLFCFLTGNADMHLKNFSLLTEADGMTGLSPAYDLVSTKLVMPEDDEEMALPINGKKSKLTRRDFEALAKTLEVPEIVCNRRISFLLSRIISMNEMIDRSFLPKDFRHELKDLIGERANRLA